MPCARGCCDVDGCTRPANEPGAARGWCGKHYQRWKKYGDPTQSTSRGLPVVDRFLAQTERQGECLVWTGTLTTDGYAQFSIDGRAVMAHRWIWERANGEVDKELELDHLCRTRKCVRLSHLEPVTHGENVRRGTSPCAANAQVTECPAGHLYDAENTWTYRGSRYCRTCRRAASAECKQRLRASA